MSYQTILTERRGRVGVVTLNRPEALNALNTTLAAEFVEATAEMDRDPEIGCLLITGSEKAFAAGADISEMQSKSYQEISSQQMFSGWDAFANLRTPKIAAINGYALGGGCELAMMCDILIAGESAKFGQPEIKIGVMPGMGGSQRLPRLVGRALAMDMVLTGRMVGAEEALRAGLVARVTPDDKTVEVAMEAATAIASYSKPAAQMAAEAVRRSEEIPLAEGLLYERRVFYSLFATEDQKEGMAAFLEKRKPDFKGR